MFLFNSHLIWHGGPQYLCIYALPMLLLALYLGSLYASFNPRTFDPVTFNLVTLCTPCVYTHDSVKHTQQQQKNKENRIAVPAGEYLLVVAYGLLTMW